MITANELDEPSQADPEKSKKSPGSASPGTGVTAHHHSYIQLLSESEMRQDETSYGQNGAVAGRVEQGSTLPLVLTNGF